MRIKLRIVALLLAFFTTSFWYVRGANMGWTKTSVAQKRKDPVTELEVDDYVKRFVPGVDFLGAGVTVAGVVAVGSFFGRKEKSA